MIRRRLLTAVAAASTLLVLAGGGAAVAAWTAQTSTTTNASAATVATTASLGGGLSTTYGYREGNAEAQFGSLTITNSGSAPLSYTLTNQVSGDQGLASKTTLTLWTGDCSAVQAGAVTTTLANTAPALPTGAASIKAGQKVTVCISTQLRGGTDAVANKTATAKFAVTGAVGTSWTTSASAGTLTQTAYRISAPTSLGCRTLSNNTVQLSWNAPANRPSGASVRYDAQVTGGATVASVTSANATASTTVDASRFDRDGSYTLVTTATEQTYGTTSVSSAGVSVRRSTEVRWVVWPIWSTRETVVTCA